MNALAAFLKYPTQLESHAAIRSVVLLRVVILSLMLLSLAYNHLNYEPHQHWPLTLATFGTTLIWSIYALNKSTVQQNGLEALREILIDVIWIFTIVSFTGRSTNPFIYYYLVITAYGAILLDRRKAWMLCALCILIYSGLLASDLRVHFQHFSRDFKNHLIGMWINFVGSAIVITLFVSSLIQALKIQQEKLLAARENNLKSEQLIGLATVSASTVHNLATPLSTLSVLIDDLEEDHQLQKQHSTDLGLMREQITRCRNTMKELSNIAKHSNDQSLTSIEKLIDDFNEHYSLHFPNSMPAIHCEMNPEHQVACTPLFKYAVINLLNNAIESSQTRPALTIKQASDVVRLSIKNKVTGSADKITERWGQPTASKKEFGLGIGSFLANSTIEQQGGSVSINVSPVEGALEQCEVEVTIDIPTPTKLT